MSESEIQMKYLDEFRNPDAVRGLAESIREAAAGLDGPVRFMEVCGGHTMAIHRFGLPSLLPDEIELLSGPGCPVCVTPASYVDRAIELGRSGVQLATFGDLYHVPGSEGTLAGAAAEDVDVQVVYSSRDALELAQESPDRTVVMLAIGFETTVPAMAATVTEAAARGIDNFRIMSGHKTMPRALAVLADAPDCALDGFILPGHVSTIIGTRPYEFLPRDHGLACCIAGFEPTDVLRAILSMCRQLADDAPEVDNAYRRAVKRDGNPTAWNHVQKVFEASPARWRGLGVLDGSGLSVREEWSDYSVEPPDVSENPDPAPECMCGEVLRGAAKPPDCPLFGTRCTPDSAVGPCMVSSEGSCAAHYKYGTEGAG